MNTVLDRALYGATVSVLRSVCTLKVGAVLREDGRKETLSLRIRVYDKQGARLSTSFAPLTEWTSIAISGAYDDDLNAILSGGKGTALYIHPGRLRRIIELREEWNYNDTRPGSVEQNVLAGRLLMSGVPPLDIPLRMREDGKYVVPSPLHPEGYEYADEYLVDVIPESIVNTLMELFS